MACGQVQELFLPGDQGRDFPQVAFPKGVGVQIRFVNPDGQEATIIYAR